MPPSASDIRAQFIDFFVERCDHTAVPSSSVMPHDDPTLLFTNAGMNQFKDVFLGRGTRPFNKAVDTQKCIRAGGKHNDLEDVGRDTYHHTFFEMLGNWSFGDYFKEDAIRWAWELLTEVWGLDKSRLYVTVFEGDEKDGLEPDVETESLWVQLTDIDPSHISQWGKKDNFWEMGDTGPCGECSEIHYDSSPDGDCGHLVNKDDPNVIELWNLVFIQFNRGEDGVLAPLPNKHVDTGMGLERIVRVIQGKTSNYDTDLWQPIFNEIQSLTKAKEYSGHLDDHVDIAYRVLADHIRCLVVAIADGCRPGAAGREYVLRRLLRRGVRHARQTFGVERPFLYKLVQVVSTSLGEVFPEIKKQAAHIESIIKDEEESFLHTLDRGLALFENAVSEGDGTSIDAQSAFELHDTFGFPIDLTEIMAEERGLTVDRTGYEQLMDVARETSRSTSEVDQKMQLPPEVIGTLEAQNIEPTDDAHKYDVSTCNSVIKAIWNGKNLVEQTNGSAVYGVILDKTPFYAQAGGQVGDAGCIHANGDEFYVQETHRFGNYVLHIGCSENGTFRCGQDVVCEIDPSRTDIESNHTSTHLLNHALRSVLGSEIQQRGSLVDKDRLRFDFSHSHPMSDEELSRVEQEVNDAIANDLLVDDKVVPLKEAQSIIGVRAIFGEQYPDPVRVVSIGAMVDQLLTDPTNEQWYQHSVEFCGGTHVNSCKSAMHFVVVHEQALASGIRRILALTGIAAQRTDEAGTSLLTQIEMASKLDGAKFVNKVDELVKLTDELTIAQTVRHAANETLKTLFHKVKSIQKETASSRMDSVVQQARTIAENGENIVVAEIKDADKDSMMTALDVVRASKPQGAVMLLGITEDSKVLISAGVSQPMIESGLRAGDWVKEAARVCGGGGGGRPDTAQAGGKEPDKIAEAINQAKTFAKEATA